MTDPVQDFYRQHAAIYERLVARQDRHGRLFAALNEISPLDGLAAVEFGAGAGNLTRLLAVLVKQVYAFDLEPAMLKLAQRALRTSGMTNWTLAIGDNARMPVAADSADVVIEGWSFAHVLDRNSGCWRSQSAAMLSEMKRILKPGGTAILIEDLGVARLRPSAPSDEAAALYSFWREEWDFSQRWIRTDYHFASPEEAVELSRFFFGDAVAGKWLAEDAVILPECTGIWWRTFA